MKKEIMYHVFSDNKDYYTEKLKEAKYIFKFYKKEFGNARLYKLICNEEGTESEDCLMSFGTYPY